MAVNQSKISWHNPAVRTNGQALSQNDSAHYVVSFDGGPAIPLPLKYGTSFDLATLAQYKALTPGNHTVALAMVDTNGLQSAFSAPASFTIASAPAAPAALTIS